MSKSLMYYYIEGQLEEAVSLGYSLKQAIEGLENDTDVPQDILKQVIDDIEIKGEE
jgi:hypothetical protein